MVSLDTILSDYKDYFPFLMKLDIEGFEDDLFSKNIGWVDQCLILIIENHDWRLPRQSN